MTKITRLKTLQNQTRRLENRLANWRARSDQFAWARLLIIGCGTVSSGILGFYVNLSSACLLMLLTLIGFGITIYYHRQIQRAIRLFQANLELKQSQIARMQLDWANIPNFSQWQADYHHPFEADLDIHGPNSLMHLIDSTIFHESTQTLRRWLTAPVPDWADIQARQQVVRELIPLTLFRDKLIIKANVVSGSRKTWGARAVIEWITHEGQSQSLSGWVVGGFMLIGLNLLLYGLAVAELIPPIWQATVLIYFALVMARARLNGAIFNEASQLQQTLRQLTTIFEQLEQFSYRRTPHLRELCQPFLSQTNRPTAAFNHLTKLVLAVSLRNNPLLWLVLNAIFPWDFWFAYRLNRHKQQIAPRAADWLARWFRLEALNSLANLAYLNPHYTLPHLVSADEHELTVFQAEQLGHPLLPDEAKVCNDFSLDKLGNITLITGSNMAGKSTFLRTLGVNLILAYAGGPVNASVMQTRLFRLFSCIKVSDSVTSGVSYFYAEVKRLKWLLMELERAHPQPLLFFIDEIFRGTNNRERFIGSTAYINALVGKNGVGFVSTHDLELAKLADKTDFITNYHFRDLIVDERMTFDYRIRFGPCPTTNALKIMAIEGLPT